MQRIQQRYRAAFITLSAALALAGPATAVAEDAPACVASQIALTSVDDGQSGMMNGERRLVARNTSRRACSVTGFPKITVFDAEQRALAIRRERRETNPEAPATVRVTIPPGASAQASLRYTEGDVYPSGYCKRSSALALTLARGTRSAAAPFHVTLCGTAAGPTISASAFVSAP